MRIETRILDTVYIKSFEDAFELIYMISFHQSLRGDTPSIHSLYIQDVINYITKNIIANGFESDCDDCYIYYALEFSLEYKLSKPNEELFYNKVAIHSYKEEPLWGKLEKVYTELDDPLTGIDH